MEVLTWIQDITSVDIASLVEVLRDIERLSKQIDDLKTAVLSEHGNNSSEFLAVARALETSQNLNDNREVIYSIIIKLSLFIAEMQEENKENEDFDLKKEAYIIPQQ